MWANPLTAIGTMSIPFLISNFATFLGFMLATYFTISYTKKFYEGRDKPASWTLIMAGLASFCISEFGQFLLPYRINPFAIEALVILIAQSSGVLMIAVGSYLLLKEVV